MKKLFLLSAMFIAFIASVNAQEIQQGDTIFHQGDTIEVPATYIESPMKCTVILPEQYAENDSVCFPVLYLLNGYGGDYTSWPLLQPGLDSLATQYGMIFVCPSGRDSWYWDSPIDSTMQMESFFVNELIPYIDANYRTIADAKYRAITGLSMGGHGALWLAIRHSDLFGSVGSTSGGVNILPFVKANPRRWKMAKSLGDYVGNEELWERCTVINLVDSLKPGQLNIIFDCGVDDFFAGVNDDLHEALKARKIAHDYISRPGNHTQSYWRNAILFQLVFFNEKFKQNKK